MPQTTQYFEVGQFVRIVEDVFYVITTPGSIGKITSCLEDAVVFESHYLTTPGFENRMSGGRRANSFLIPLYNVETLPENYYFEPNVPEEETRVIEEETSMFEKDKEPVLETLIQVIERLHKRQKFYLENKEKLSI